MSITSIAKTRADTTPQSAWAAVWEWLARPTHYRAVRNFRLAAASGNATWLASLLEPNVAVVVDAGHPGHQSVRVVDGVHDAIALLRHGLGEKPGRAIAERSVNGQAGLVISDDDTATATMTVDFTGRLISVVWIRLRPEMLRHWNTV